MRIAPGSSPVSVFKAPGGRLGDALVGRVLALGDVVMMRKQLLTLKELAEHDVR